VINRQPRTDAATAHPTLVQDSALNYRDHLAESLELFSKPIRPGVEKLITLLDRVVADTPITSAIVEYAVEDMALAQEGDMALLINEWCLGWGHDDAPIVVMGTEEAYLPCPVDLGQWNACCSVIWATSGRRDVLYALDQRHKYPLNPPPAFEDRREFHLHANDYYRVHHRRGRHTYRLVAEVIAGDAWLDLLKENTGTLGDLAYQIEVSSYPARHASGGRDQTARRHEFLTRLLQTVRSTASVLIFHGKPEQPEWGGRARLASTFLGDSVSWSHEVIAGQAIRFDNKKSGRLVVLTRALNGNVDGALLDRLHDLVLPFLPDR
jgi:hypothetical protein